MELIPGCLRGCFFGSGLTMITLGIKEDFKDDDWHDG